MPGTTRTTIYFLTDGGTAPISVRRTIEARSPYAREALEALVAGERVWLLNDGRPWGLILRDGRIDNGPFDYRDLVGWNLGRGCPGTEAVVCDHFTALP